MKFTYNWIKDFIPVDLSPGVLAKKLTMAGLEVVAWGKKDGDVVFEVEITSNRPDWTSVIGIAREVAAITNKKIKIPPVSAHRTPKKGKASFTIVIEESRDCPLYTARIIQGVRVGQSPEWLKKRLELIGCRTINNIVDSTNYILFTWGQPLHAFDLDTLPNPDKIVIRRARPGEAISAIDNTIRTLDTEVLVIASGSNIASSSPIAVAGVIGGKDTEVTGRTRNVLLESAVFNPVVIRRGRQKLGIQTESAYRFERGVGLSLAHQASFQAMELIQSCAGGRCSIYKSQGLAKPRKKKITLPLEGGEKFLGVAMAPAKIKQILSNLGFGVTAGGKKSLAVAVPDHRLDVSLSVDLIEEIGRIAGYEKIPTTIPSIIPTVSQNDVRRFIAGIKKILVGLGLHEVVTHSLIDRQWLDDFGYPGSNPVEIANPLSQGQAVLRPCLSPSLIRIVANNLNQKQEPVKLFEIAKGFSLGSAGQVQETWTLGIAVCGTASRLLEQGAIKDKVSLLHLKGLFEVLFERYGIQGYGFSHFPEGCPRDTEESVGGVTVPSDIMRVDISIRQEKIGMMMGVSGGTLEKFEIKNQDVFVAELNLEKFFTRAKHQIKFTPLPRYPGISRDISVMLKKEISAAQVLAAIKGQAGPLLKEAKVIDCYEGKQIPQGYKSLTVSCLYRADERTLTEKDIDPLHAGVIKFITQAFTATIR